MERADGKRTKYILFGHDFVVKDQVSEVARFVKAMKGVVDEAVKVFDPNLLRVTLLQDTLL